MAYEYDDFLKDQEARDSDNEPDPDYYYDLYRDMEAEKHFDELDKNEKDEK